MWTLCWIIWSLKKLYILYCTYTLHSIIFPPSELVFVARSPFMEPRRIDSQAGVPVGQLYLSYRPDMLHRKPIPRESIPGLHKRLQIRALFPLLTSHSQNKQLLESNLIVNFYDGYGFYYPKLFCLIICVIASQLIQPAPSLPYGVVGCSRNKLKIFSVLTEKNRN